MISEEFGGRIELAKAYYKALTASIKKHLQGNGAIASMEHCNDFMYLGTEAIALGRVGMETPPCFQLNFANHHQLFVCLYYSSVYRR